MKKYSFVIAFLCCMPFNGRTQTPVNTPVVTATSPLVPTVSLVVLPHNYTSSTVLNVTRTFIPMKPEASESAPMFTLAPVGLSNYYCKVGTTYTNGWGDVIETISRGSTTSNDIMVSFDKKMSRTKTSYLPFIQPTGSRFNTAPFTVQFGYYASHFIDENQRGYSQSVTTYPGTIATLKTCAAGSSFVGNGNGTTVTSTINKATDGIQKLTDVSGSLYCAGTYGDGQLTVKTTTKPHSRKTKEYYDKNNRLICKQVDAGTYYGTSLPWINSTYYVYNDLGQMVHLVTPGPAYVIGSYPTYDVRSRIYSTEYNDYGSPVTTNIVGKDAADHVVYDKKNRVVLKQTALLQTMGKYEFFIYDTRDRVILSGLFTDSNPYTYWQAQLYSSSAPTYSLLVYILDSYRFGYSTLPSIPACEIEQANFYDQYTVPRTFDNSQSALYWTNAQSVPPVPYMVTNGLLTASMARVRDGGMAASSDLWACSVFFYDQKGNVIQVQTLNAQNAASYATCASGAPLATWDVLTSQYSFSGQKLLDIQSTNFAGSDKPLTLVVDRYYLDMTNGGRLDSVNHRIDGGNGVTIAAYTYDDMGRTTQKSMGHIEIQDYDYNIRGQLTGINRAYALNPCSVPGKTATFGCMLSYDHGFTMPRYDGIISGFQWRGAAHTVPLRAYGYQYDPVGRLNHAEFRQFCDPTSKTINCVFSTGTENWNKSKADFTMSNVRYNDEGGLLTMNQRGTTSGAPVDMDKLSYQYNSGSGPHRLINTTDAITLNWALGDFVDVVPFCGYGLISSPGPGHGEPGAEETEAPQFIPSGMESSLTFSTGAIRGGGVWRDDLWNVGLENNVGTDLVLHTGDVWGPDIPGGGVYAPCYDYHYDADGNLTSDSNKHITSIVYNEKDQPLSVTYRNGSTIKNTYLASGVLIKKEIHVDGATPDESYINSSGFNFKSKGSSLYELQYMLHQEGRARYDKSGYFFYDYFVKDHLGNVRTVVTGNQTNYATPWWSPDYPGGFPTTGGPGGTSGPMFSYIATHEIVMAGVETALFTNIDRVRGPKPASLDTADAETAILNGADSAHRIGTAILLKVMAGDKFDLSAQSYWEADSIANTTAPPSTMFDAILSTLTGAQANSAFGEGAGAAAISGTFNPANYSAYQAILDSITDTTAPKAYINYLVYDNDMNLLPDQSGAIQVSNIAGSWEPMTSGAAPMEILESGYLAVYLSSSTVGRSRVPSSGPGGLPGTSYTTDVYVDEFIINLYSGTLIQEQHYYPFGLTIGGEAESSTVLKNKFKFQGKEYTEMLTTDAAPTRVFGSPRTYLYDFTARTYDPQIGRFLNVDPANQYPDPYTGMGNNPANLIDPTGCEVVNQFHDPSHDFMNNPDVYPQLGASNSSYLDDDGWYDIAKETYKNATQEEMEARAQNGKPADATSTNPGIDQKSADETKTENNQESTETTDAPNVLKKEGSDKGNATSAAVPIAVALSSIDGPLPLGDAIGVLVVAAAVTYDETQKTHVTYTLTNAETGQIYIGKTSGYGSPEKVMKDRYAGHERRAQGYGNPQLDKYAIGLEGKAAIRGREQQMIDHYGGVGSRRVGNIIRGVSKYNFFFGKYYHNSSNSFFGELSPYTGY